MKNQDIYPLLSVVIPQYNELNNLKQGRLKETHEFLEKMKVSYELIISDDCSTDGSIAFAEKFASDKQSVKLLNNEHGGKAYAISKAVAKANGELLLFMDMDLSTPLKYIPIFIENLKSKNSDVVIGKRNVEENMLLRKIASYTFKFFRRSLLLKDIEDTQCGFKLLKTLDAKKVFPLLDSVKNIKKPKGWKVTAFDVEMLHILNKMQKSIVEIEVTWNDRDFSTSKNKKFIQESIKMFLEIIRIKINDFKGEYNSI